MGGVFTEDEVVRNEELQHCDEVHVDVEETIEKQKDRIKEYKKDEDRHFTEAGRVAEMTIDLVFQARAKMAEERVNGPEDSIATEMIKQLAQEKYTKLQGASKTALRVCKKRPAPAKSRNWSSCGRRMLSRKKG